MTTPTTFASVIHWRIPPVFNPRQRLPERSTCRSTLLRSVIHPVTYSSLLASPSLQDLLKVCALAVSSSLRFRPLRTVACSIFVPCPRIFSTRCPTLHSWRSPSHMYVPWLVHFHSLFTVLLQFIAAQPSGSPVFAGCSTTNNIPNSLTSLRQRPTIWPFQHFQFSSMAMATSSRLQTLITSPRSPLSDLSFRPTPIRPIV